MSYADYLSQHSYIHCVLGRNMFLGAYPRLCAGLSSEEYTRQLELLKVAIQSSK